MSGQTAPTRGTQRAAGTGRRSIRARVRALPGGAIAWRVGTTIVGVAIIAAGIVLLPLPGPGWVIIFGGLGVLASEYEWARRLLTWTREQVRRWTRWFAARPWWVHVLAGLVVIAFVALAVWWYFIR